MSLSHYPATSGKRQIAADPAPGFVPFLRILNSTAAFVNGTHRRGQVTVTLDIWHADVFHYLTLHRRHGCEQHRARDIGTSLWLPDLFMRRVEGDQKWSLFCPEDAPGLTDVAGGEFDVLYESYEAERLESNRVSARSLLLDILRICAETGYPSILFRDKIVEA